MRGNSKPLFLRLPAGASVRTYVPTLRSLLLALPLIAACGGEHEGTDLPPDGATIEDDGASSTCTAGETCTPTEACHAGVTACDANDQPTCTMGRALPEGTDCGQGNVCAQGACVPPCDAGLERCGGQCVDTETSNDHCGQCGMTCDASSTCAAGTCKPGAAVAASGTCTYTDQPGWLSCPTGMSCRCYYYNHKLVDNQPAHLDTWLADTQLEILGGMIPNNQTMSGVTPATIALVASGATRAGNTPPYTATVSATGALQIKIYATSGYVPQRSILYSSSDCGNQGKRLECTFTSP